MHFKSILPLLGLAASASAQVSASQMTANIDQITQKSSETNDIAKSISVTNFFSTAPQLINSFRDIIQTASDDVTSMNDGKSKRSLKARQECLDLEDPEQCLADLGELVDDPSEILGDKRALRARQECLDVTDIEQCLADLGELVEDPGEILGDKRSVKVRHEYASVSRWREIANILNQTVGKKRQDPPAYSDSQQQGICNAFRSFVMVHQELLKTVIGKHGLLSLTPFTQPVAQVLRVLEGGVDTLAFGIIDSVPTCAQEATQNKNSLDMTLEEAQNTYDSN
ncbi:uncharacterized protein APUU_80037A [Aspergillus puulaauensis]|uniref:Fungal N-terminal domain-containing protein n=1 Tax=Aspergillus puulaauensis TaxID=1220207 RepID=A0A7R7XY88_9EURO|nr:uncharacterized protein APUU_80037A [Aspergillus puulaauensis]BCS29734.1 hypothetical protein APUU_80037A [Aspergillus puulaauensis]